VAKQTKKKPTPKASAARSAKKAPARRSALQKAVKKKAAAGTKKKVAKKSPAKKAAAKKTTARVTKKKTTTKTKKATKKKVAKKSAVKKKTAAKKVVKQAASKKKAAKAPTKKKKAANQTSVKKASVKKKTTAKKVTKKAASPKAPAKVSKSAKKTTKNTALKKKFTPPRVPYAALAAAPAPAYNPHDHEPLTPAQLRKVKTGLTAKDLRFFRQELLERRAEIIGDVQGLEAARAGKSGDIGHMPLHMADVGSDNYEQEFTLGLMEYERKIIIEIDDALQRVVDKTYGVCVESGVFIGRPRLEAKPWAKYCIEVARERERRGL